MFVGCRHFPAPVYDRRSLEELTHREREVLTSLGSGLSNRQIARRLDVTERTVKAHVTRILEKLSVQSRLEAALVVVTHHWSRDLHGGEAACGCHPDPVPKWQGTHARGARGPRGAGGGSADRRRRADPE
ncbi:response regulator transcription factor [Nocardiopsis aegyptia]|uniref:response regulator transcription factor n=1 Tax=Nocardiopsis aegyptia TaxID=220378 RepID=UPI0028A63C00|nr:response regulator transcription factor [Nocardiopsis aegyptia]